MRVGGVGGTVAARGGAAAAAVAGHGRSHGADGGAVRGGVRWPRARQLTRRELQAWTLKHPARMRWARTLLADAVWAGEADGNPFDGVRRPPRRGLKVVPPSVKDVADLAWGAGPHGDEVLVAAYSGLRLSELCRLRAGDVAGGHVTVLRKGGLVKTSLIFPPGREAVEGRRGRGDNLLFPRRDGRPQDRQSVNAWWCLRAPCSGRPRARPLPRSAALPCVVARGSGRERSRHSGPAGHADGGELARRRYVHPDPDVALDRIMGAVR
jgi:integrase